MKLGFRGICYCIKGHHFGLRPAAANNFLITARGSWLAARNKQFSI